jgi:hypothetical protein
MPKRKREEHASEASKPDRRTGAIDETIQAGKKALNKALKTAKGFEWQKIMKRQGNAKKEDGGKAAAEVERLERELKMLKGLEMAALAEQHIHKTLLKTKRIAESGLLPSYVVLPPRKEGISEEERVALDNVTARLYNVKAVKENMNHIVRGVYAAGGIPNPADEKPKQLAKKEKKAKEEPTKKKTKVEPEDHDREEDKEHAKAVKKGVEPAWDGFDSGSEADTEEEIDFSKYEGRLGGSSDEESIDFDKYQGLVAASSDEESDSDKLEIRRPTSQSKRYITSRGISVSVSGSDAEPDEDEEGEVSLPDSGSEAEVQGESDADEQETSGSESDNVIERPSSPKAKKAKVTKEPPKPLKAGSQFLPTLMGGYWSGSEEEASDIEDDAPKPRKNRPGQQARRAIWEKKFGAQAKHLKEGAANGKNGRDADWDTKRGARGADDRGPRGRGDRGRGGARGGFGGGRGARMTGENTAPLGERMAPVKPKRDDVGVLHPSWQAAKKAKEQKTMAQFQGKKVVFD